MQRIDQRQLGQGLPGMLATMDYQLARPSSDRFPRVVEHQLEGGPDPSFMGTMLFDVLNSQLGSFPSISGCNGNPSSYMSVPTLHDRFTFSDIMHLPDSRQHNSSSFTAQVSRSLQYGDIMEDGDYHHAIQDLPLGHQACPSIAGSFVSPDDFQSKVSDGSIAPDHPRDAVGYRGQRSVQTDFLCTANWPAAGAGAHCEGQASSSAHVQSPAFCLDIGALQESFDGSPAALPTTYRGTSLPEQSDCPGSLSSPFQQLSSIMCGANTTRGSLPSSMPHDNAYIDLCQSDLAGSCVDDEIATNSKFKLSVQPDLDISNGSPSTDTDGVSDKAGDDGLSTPSSFPTSAGVSQSNSGADQAPAASNSGGSTLPKRKRSKPQKNTEDVESQRMTHIAVERNRRKQMNEHLNVLRSLMPGSYVHKGDQASIIGGAIEFVKELEHLLQCLQSQKRRRLFADNLSPRPTHGPSLLQPAAFPVYPRGQPEPKSLFNDKFCEPVRETLAESKSAVADVEVKMVGSEALVKIMSARRPGQLVKAMSALESLHLTITHTNITTIDHTVLYSFTVTMGKECRMTVDELAAAVQQTFAAIHNIH